MPNVDYQAGSYDRDHDQGGEGEKCQRERRVVVGLPHHEGREHADRGKAHAEAQPDVAGGWRPGGDAGGEVSGERGQLGGGPRGGRLGRPRVVFILGQPALRQRGLEGAGRLLARDGHDQLVTGSRACRGPRRERPVGAPRGP